MPKELNLQDILFFNCKKGTLTFPDSSAYLGYKIASYLPVQSLFAMSQVNHSCYTLFKSDEIWKRRYEEKIDRCLSNEELENFHEDNNNEYIDVAYRKLFYDYKNDHTANEIDRKLEELIYQDDVETLQVFARKEDIDIKMFELHHPQLISDDSEEFEEYIISPFIFAATTNSINILWYIFDSYGEDKRSLVGKNYNGDGELCSAFSDKTTCFRDYNLAFAFKSAVIYGHIRVIEELCKMLPALGLKEKQVFGALWGDPNGFRSTICEAIDNQYHDLISFIFSKCRNYDIDLKGLMEVEKEKGIGDPHRPFMCAINVVDVKILQLLWNELIANPTIDKGLILRTNIERCFVHKNSLSKKVVLDSPYLKLLALGDEAIQAKEWIKKRAEEEQVDIKKSLIKLLFDFSGELKDETYDDIYGYDCELGEPFMFLMEKRLGCPEISIALLDSVWQEAESYRLPCYRLLRMSNEDVFRDTISRGDCDALNWLMEKSLEVSEHIEANRLNNNDNESANRKEMLSFFSGILYTIKDAIMQKYMLESEFVDTFESGWKHHGSKLSLEDLVNAFVDMKHLTYENHEFKELFTLIYEEYGIDGIKGVFNGLLKRVEELESAFDLVQRGCEHGLKSDALAQESDDSNLEQEPHSKRPRLN